MYFFICLEIQSKVNITFKSELSHFIASLKLCICENKLAENYKCKYLLFKLFHCIGGSDSHEEDCGNNFRMTYRFIVTF